MPEKMMDKFDRWSILLLKMAVIFLLLIAYLMFVAWWLSPETDNGDMMQHHAPVVQPTEAEKRYVEKRHKHHGIHSSVIDRSTGERYFYRDGKKCKL